MKIQFSVATAANSFTKLSRAAFNKLSSADKKAYLKQFPNSTYEEQTAKAPTTGAKYKKGDIVATQDDDGKWVLGTVTVSGSKRIVVETHDADYEIKAASADKWIKPVDVSGLTKTALKQAMKKQYTLTQLKAFKPKAEKTPPKAKPAPKVKPEVKPTPKVQPAPEPKPEPKVQPKATTTPVPVTKDHSRKDDLELMFLRDSNQTGTHLSSHLPSELKDPMKYAKTAYGRVVNTGRASSYLSSVILVGTIQKNGKHFWVGHPARDTTNKARVLLLPWENSEKYKNHPQVSLAELERHREDARKRLTRLNDNQDAREQKAAEVQATMDLKVGNDALIEFSNTTAWKRILEVDYRRNVIYIAGSRTKRRSIPMSLIQKTRAPNT